MHTHTHTHTEVLAFFVASVCNGEQPMPQGEEKRFQMWGVFSKWKGGIEMESWKMKRWCFG